MVKGSPAHILNGFKLHINKKIKNAQDFREGFEETFDTVIDSKISLMISELNDQRIRMENKFYGELTALVEEEESGKLQTEVDAYATKVDKAVGELESFLRNLRDKVSVPTDSGTNNADANAGAHGSTTAPSKIDDTLKPDELSRSATLEEFNIWSERFQAYFTHNKKTLDRCDIAIPRQLLNNCLDYKLVNALKTNDGITANTPVIGENGCLDMLKQIFHKECPLFIRRFNYLRCTQDPGESFSDWWVSKKAKAQECEFEKMKKEDMLLLGLMMGVHDPKLKEEFQRQRDPTVDALVAIAENWQYAEKNMECMSDRGATVRRGRTQSHYKAGQRRDWQNRHGGRSHSGSQDRDCKFCGYRTCKGITKCRAKGKTCNGCQGKDHFAKVCPKKNPEVGKGDEPSTSQTRAIRVCRTAIDDNVPVPYAEMIFTPLDGEKEIGKAFEISVYPDQGASQSIISYDIAKDFGMVINRRDKKKIKDAQNGNMDCTGSTDFRALFEGNKTSVRALVTKSLKNECLLGWKALQRLKIIPENFPHAILDPAVKSIACEVKGDDPSMSAKSGPDNKAAEMPIPNSSFDVSLPIETRIERIIEEHPVVTDTSGPLKTMKGGEMKIHLKKDSDVRPLHIFTPRKVPYAFEDAAKAKLDEDERLGVIEKVEGTSVWCNPISFVPKKNGIDARSILDVVVLNKAVDRPTHPFPSPKDIVSTIPSSTKLFAVFDCLNGYWQIPLDEESKPLTTFLTEWGRYRYCRAPMGLVSSGDEFCARTDKALADLPGVKKLVDDILVFADNEEDLVKRIRNVFKRCEDWGITLTKAKYQFGNKVNFAGYVLTDKGVSPDPKKIEAIKNFSTPENVTDVRSWFGLVEGFAEFVPDLKMAMVPLQGLMSPKNAFIWTSEHQKSMDKTKEIITDPNGPVLRHFDPSLPVALYTDASRNGIGFILTQKDENGHLRLITCGSRFISNAERNYAVVELECLAIQWAVEKCRLYLAGTDFTVFTDHKPLLGILNGKNMEAQRNTRIQRLMSKLLGYSYTVEWIEGKRQVIADALSRYPVFEPEEVTDVLLRHVSCAEVKTDLALKELSEAASEDPTYKEIMKAIMDKKALKDLPTDHPGTIFKGIWDFLCVDDRYNLLLCNDRILVPKLARRGILEKLHGSHCGITKTYNNAKQLYFWPAMKSDIKNFVSSCEECIALLPSQSLEPKIVTTASRPFEAVSIDLGKQNGVQHLILADRYSGWPMAKPLKRLDTTAITDILEEWFIDTGKPERIRSDGGPQFRSEFTEWCKKQGIHHELSSAYHHESNGHAEAAVRDMKHLLEKTSNFMKFRKALREYRNTQRHDGLSSAQWLFGRRQRTDVPALPQAYKRLSNDEVEFYENRRREEVESKVKNSPRSLPQLSVGQIVLVQNPLTNRWRSRGTITKMRDQGRSYYVNIDGKEKLRNRRFLRPCLNQDLPHLDEKPISNEIVQDEEPDIPEAQPLRKSDRTRKKTVRFEA